MTTFHGSLGAVYVGTNKVAEVNDFQYSEEADFAEDTPGDETDVTYNAIPIKRWSGTINCWFDDTDTNGQEAIMPGNSVTLNLRPEGTGSGLYQASGTALITGLTLNKVKAGIIERSFTFIGSGALDRTAQT